MLRNEVIAAISLVSLILGPVHGGDWTMMIPAAPKDYKQNENVSGGGTACEVDETGVFSFEQQDDDGDWMPWGVDMTTAFDLEDTIMWAHILNPANHSLPNDLWPLSPWPPGPPPPIARKADYKVELYHNYLEIARTHNRVVPP